ncbi:helix-turn-helix domain-containing protein [Patescibacteria group bacterium]|nr:helix-turn-helix domain-containing protein [Patescibacteria group bacterium]
MEKIFTPDQVGKMLQIHPFTVLKYIKQGKLKGSKIGRVYRIKESNIDRFLDSM